ANVALSLPPAPPRSPPIPRPGRRGLPGLTEARRLIADDESLLAPRREVLERNTLVGTGILRKAEDALGDDVTQDLVRAACDAQTGRPHVGVVEGALHRSERWIGNDAVMVFAFDR